MVPFNHLLCEPSANTLAESSLLICEVLVSGRDAGRASQEARGSSQGSSPKGHDLYDDESAAEFQRATDEYIDRRIHQALEPHAATLQNSKWEQQYNAMVATHGSDEGFKMKMDMALRMVADNNGKISIPEAYAKVDDRDAARPGK